MEFNRQFNRDRTMFSGEWICSECGKTITELPFEPRENSTVMCQDCYRKSRY